MRRRWCGREGGQALVETALVLPILILLVVGVYTASELISAENTATVASRNAARLGAELGNDDYQPGVTSPDPTSVDRRIVATANAALAGRAMPNATVTEIDVYQPSATQPAGYFNPSDVTMLSDRYNPDGTAIAPWQYGLDARNQLPTTEAQIGVRVVITFTPSSIVPGAFGGFHSVYTVFTFPPQ